MIKGEYVLSWLRHGQHISFKRQRDILPFKRRAHFGRQYYPIYLFNTCSGRYIHTTIMIH